MSLEQTIGDLESRLRAAGASVASICRAAGIDRGTWQDWKRGKRPRPGTWQRVAAAIEARLGYRPDGPDRPASAAGGDQS